MRLVDSEPEIDPDNDEGKTVATTEGRLELRDIHFRYREESHTGQPPKDFTYLFHASHAS